MATTKTKPKQPVVLNVVSGIEGGEKSNRQFALFALLMAKEQKKLDVPELRDFLSDLAANGQFSKDLANAVTRAINAHWDKYRGILTAFNSDDIREALRHAMREDQGINAIPVEGVNRLILRLLDLKAGDSIADFGCGIGMFLLDAYEYQPELKLFGVEINPSCCLKAEMLMRAFNVKAEISNNNIFKVPAKVKYDKILAIPTWGMRSNSDDAMRNYAEGNPTLPPTKFSADWLWAVRVMESLEKGGKAVIVMTNGDMQNTNDRLIRKYFIDRGYVESVIALPEKMFVGTNIPVSLLVLSYSGKCTRLVDASKEFVASRKLNQLDGTNVENIVKSIDSSGKLPVGDFKSTDFSEDDFILYPGKYLGRQKFEYENCVKLGDVVIDITRGAPLGATELDEAESQISTGISYLKVGNLENGAIVGSLPSLRADFQTHRHYMLKCNDLLLSKTGAPFKAAVVADRNGADIVATGNMFIIRLDTSRVNPYYVLAYLQSAEGLEQLASLSSGSSIPNLSLANLQELRLPLRPPEEQERFAAEYRKFQDDVLKKRQELDEANKALTEFVNSINNK